MQPKNDGKIVRSYGPSKDDRPTFRFRIDLTPNGLITKPQFVFAADHDDALAKLADLMGPVPYEVDGQPLRVSS